MGATQLLRFAVFRVEVELNFATGALLRRVDHACIKRPRIDVKANSTLIEFAGINDFEVVAFLVAMASPAGAAA